MILSKSHNVVASVHVFWEICKLVIAHNLLASVHVFWEICKLAIIRRSIKVRVIGFSFKTYFRFDNVLYTKSSINYNIHGSNTSILKSIMNRKFS